MTAGTKESAEALKRAVAVAALRFVQPGDVLGVGSGSTVDHFIDALVASGLKVAAVVAASERTAQRLAHGGMPVRDLNTLDTLSVYIDGADEIDPGLSMIKGGGAALTREKIVAAVARTFVCIADARKRVDMLGAFALPVEVIPMARAYVMRQMLALGGTPVPRVGVVTDNGNEIVDVHGLRIADPRAMEARIDAIAGVVTHGIFAARGADVLLIADAGGVTETRRP